MTDDSALDELPLGTLVVVGALLLAALTLPTFAPGTGPEEPDASNGTIVTPDGTELEEVNRGPIDGLNVLPGSHLMDDSPTVHASTGAQTMRVETTTVDGEPALNLSDDRTHDGRWVAVPTEWFNETHGEVPSVARIAHEDGGTYTEPLQVRGDSAAFFVRGFSTNTVTFGGELVIQDRPAVDGTRHTYELDSRDSVDDVSINLTGVSNTAPDSASAVRANGETLTASVAGSSPQDETVTLTGVETTASGSVDTGTVSDGYTTSVSVGGNQPARDAQVTITGGSTSSTSRSQTATIGPGETLATLDSSAYDNRNADVSVSGTGNLEKTKSFGSNSLGHGGSISQQVDTSDIDQISSVTATIDQPNNYNVQTEVYVDGVYFGSRGTSWGDGTETHTWDDASVSVDDTTTIKFEDPGGDGYYTGPEGGSITIASDAPNNIVANANGGGGSVSLGSGGSGSLSLTSDTTAITLTADGDGTIDASASWDEIIPTEDPSVSIGGATVSHSGYLPPGETVTESVTLSSGSKTLDVSTNARGVEVAGSWTEVTATEDPSVSVGGSTVSHSGILGPGETVTESVSLSTGTNTLDVSTGGKVEVAASWTEVAKTRDPVVELNGETVGVDGTLNDGETVSLDANTSWVHEGTNNVTVRVGDGSYSGDGPEPQVELEYRHDLESPRTVTYESEALSERYNVSKTYTTQRADASLRIPHARTVLSMRSVEYRLNETGSWSSVPEYAANLSGTTLSVDVSELAGNPVPEGTTVELRSTGSRVDVHDGEISVERATPVGFDLNSRVQLDSWSSGSYIEVGETPQSGLVHYAENESYTAESDYVELYSDGGQRFYAPNATSGSTLTLQTLSARVSPDRNSMRVRVPESVNATSPRFVVEPASVVGDSWSAEYVAGTDGEWYAVVDDSGEELGVAQKPSPIEVSRDDVGLVSIEPSDEPTAADSGTVGGGVFAAVNTGNLPSLVVLFGSVGLLFVSGSAPARSRDAVDGLASSAGGALSNIPRVGETIWYEVESALSGAGNAAVSVGENRLLTGALGAAVVVAAAEAGLFTIGSETGAILTVAGIAVGSLFLLREADEFTTARWIAIVGVAGVVALQGLGEGDLLAQIVESDAFLIAVLIFGYAAIQLVREYRANNGPNDDRPQIVFRSDGGSDDEGSS